LVLIRDVAAVWGTKAFCTSLTACRFALSMTAFQHQDQGAGKDMKHLGEMKTGKAKLDIRCT